MDSTYGSFNRAGKAPSRFVNFESTYQQNDATAAPVKPLTEAFFNDISKRLGAEVQKKEWTNRPRTWFILNQIKRLDAMEAFISQGLNDTSLPYKGRNSLPETLNFFEANDFMKWQESVVSDILYLEQGQHLRITNGDVLFESSRPKLGVGSQGSSVVDQVVSKATGKVYARKRINRAKLFGHDTQAQKIYENEIKVLSKVAEDDHLIKVRGTYTDKKYLAMLLEPVADGNLKQYMNKGPLTSIEEQNRFRTYFGCLAHTIRFLHDSSIETLHKDIKPENILLKDGHLILTDFGTAFDWSKTGQSMTRSNVGDHRTPRYQSPEVATSSEFRRSSDIWSLGVVFLEMVTVLRGKYIAEMDTFLQNNGHRHTEIHLNLDAAMNWFEQLQAHGRGSPIDNEPLSWIKRMLNRVQSSRPTAAAIYQDIAAFHDGMFCGRCCSDTESSSSADEDFQTDFDMLSDVMEHDELTLTDPWMEKQDTSASRNFSLPMVEITWNDNFREPWLGNQGSSESRNFSSPMIEVTQKESDISGFQGTQADNEISSSIEKDNVGLGPGSGADVAAPLPSEKKSQDVTGTSNSTSGVSHTKKATAKTTPKPFVEKETFVRWLASLPDKLKTPLPENLSVIPASLPGRPTTRHPTVESRRIGHFLLSLPEEPSGYESASGAHSERIIEGIDHLKRSQTSPTFEQAYLDGSHSQEELLTPSHLLAEETDNEQFSGVTNSKLVHYASDGALNLALSISEQTLGEAIEDLKVFAATTTVLKPNSVQRITPEESKERSTKESKGSGFGLKATADSAPEQSLRTPEVQASVMASIGSHSTKPPEPPLLGAYLKGVPKRHRRRWESATVIMGRILDDKISEAPTSVMSVNTRAKISHSRPVLRWNDRFYGYLPSFVANGKVGAVKEMLSAGCNPGTVEKPRWAPIYNAIRGATDKHTKCLRALVSYGVNVNAVKTANGRRPLHYAIEKPPWSGYTSVIYTLLAAEADPNARDKANDVPLLMLLVGEGPLTQEKRDALYLLLAPDFATNLDVSIPGTLDNPLHLAVRRKDAYTVDVILEKMKQVQGDALSLMHKHNGSGFTPLLLAFTIFTLLGEEADEELQIIKLLLEHGANPDDQDVAHGETPLHLVVRASKHTIALELLCRQSTNATLTNHAGQSAIDVAHKLRLEHPRDKWYLFAKRRMSNELKDEHYRPPEILAFLDDEAGQDKKDKDDDNKVDDAFSP
ncbi:MAG: hypothetical protein ASARMPRED_002957 [Alectoria sarmentosa]|nr:MAG: hypothetical protein ASARMPRED_002957 [Alectoria sarmentosa]